MTLKSSWLRIGTVALVALVSLLPWLKQRDHLRDFYDYGLVISGVGRIAAGERPYVDFVTPIQTATFAINGWAEKLAGSTFQGMTVGCALLILGGVIALSRMLSRRWSPMAATLVAGAVICGSVVQHTIVWHNTLGVVCLAVVAWSGALAPVLRRSAWRWSLVVGVALLIGGMNKLNAQLVAIVVALGWSLRAGIIGRARWGDVLLTVAFVLTCGLVVPVLVELAWTGASPRLWWHNVIGLSTEDRAANLIYLLDPQYYLRPLHDYYGPLRLPQLGLIGMVMTAIVSIFAWRRARASGSKADPWLTLAAGLMACLASLCLMATNHEIAYVGMAAWIALLVAMWLGFELPVQGWVFRFALILPVTALGAVFWESAWRGQRAQFGHSAALRSEYVRAETIGGSFQYLRGTRVPPDIAASMAATAEWRDALEPSLRSRIFHGPGLEFLDRIWSQGLRRGEPLWMHIGTTYLEEEARRLGREFEPGGSYDFALVPFAYDHLPPVVRTSLENNGGARALGPVWKLYQRETLHQVAQRPFTFLHRFGGNVDPRLLTTEMDMVVAPDDRLFLGVAGGEGVLRFIYPSYRINGEILVLRSDEEDLSAPAMARFEILAEADEGTLLPRWSSELVLPAGTRERVQRFAVEGMGRPLRFRVSMDAPDGARVTAGWRALQLTHAFDSPDLPGRMSEEAPDAVPMDEASLQAMLPDSWRPERAFTRGGRLTADGFVLPAHGEIWLWTSRVTELRGDASVPAGVEFQTWASLRTVGYKGGRMDITSQDVSPPGERGVAFRTWSAEPGSWLVLIARPEHDAPPVAIKVHSVKVSD